MQVKSSSERLSEHRLLCWCRWRWRCSCWCVLSSSYPRGAWPACPAARSARRSCSPAAPAGSAGSCERLLSPAGCSPDAAPDQPAGPPAPGSAPPWPGTNDKVLLTLCTIGCLFNNVLFYSHKPKLALVLLIFDSFCLFSYSLYQQVVLFCICHAKKG